MFLQQVNVFVWLMRTVVSISWDTMTTHHEYAKIEADVECIPSSISLTLGDVNNVQYLVRCSALVMPNALCLTAAYYSSLPKCTILAADISQRRRQPAAFAQVINMIDRGTLWASGGVRKKG